MTNNPSLSAIQAMVEDYQFLQEKVLLEEPSMAQRIQRHLLKMFVLACASCYEHQIISAIQKYAQEHSKKYGTGPHSFDELEKISFFKLFDFGREKLKPPVDFLRPMNALGRQFKADLVGETNKDKQKVVEMTAFQEMCAMRNSMAHNDLIIADDAIAEKTFENVRSLHSEALKYVAFLVSKLRV